MHVSHRMGDGISHPCPLPVPQALQHPCPRIAADSQCPQDACTNIYGLPAGRSQQSSRILPRDLSALPMDRVASAGEPCCTAEVSCASTLGLHDRTASLAASEYATSVLRMPAWAVPTCTRLTRMLYNVACTRMHVGFTCRGGRGCCCAGHHVGSDRHNAQLQQLCTLYSGRISAWSYQAPEQLADLAKGKWCQRRLLALTTHAERGYKLLTSAGLQPGRASAEVDFRKSRS